MSAEQSADALRLFCGGWAIVLMSAGALIAWSKKRPEFSGLTAPTWDAQAFGIAASAFVFGCFIMGMGIPFTSDARVAGWDPDSVWRPWMLAFGWLCWSVSIQALAIGVLRQIAVPLAGGAAWLAAAALIVEKTVGLEFTL